MKRRTNGGQPRDISAHLQPLVDDDAFLTALSRGDDPSDGTDPLAGLLLGLRADVNRQVPPAPLLDAEPDGETAGAPGADDADEQPVTVTPIGDAPSRRRGISPWAAGLTGAAAATALVIGTGAALYGATPGSPLWGPASALFGDRAAAVQLAGTLDELEAANASGDTDQARHLLDHARELVGTMNPGADSRDRGRLERQEREPGATVSEQATPRVSEPKTAPATSQPGGTPASATVTERVTETVTVSVTPEPEPTRARPAEPGPATVTVPQAPAQPAPPTQLTDGGVGDPGQGQAAETTARASEAAQR